MCVYSYALTHIQFKPKNATAALVPPLFSFSSSCLLLEKGKCCCIFPSTFPCHSKGIVGLESAHQSSELMGQAWRNLKWTQVGVNLYQIRVEWKYLSARCPVLLLTYGLAGKEDFCFRIRDNGATYLFIQYDISHSHMPMFWTITHVLIFLQQTYQNPHFTCDLCYVHQDFCS